MFTITLPPAWPSTEQDQVRPLGDRAGEVGVLLQPERKLTRIALGLGHKHRQAKPQHR
jgi:hypothetical protein